VSGRATEADAAAIEGAITQLVQRAPALPADVVRELCDRLERDGSPLALTIARVVQLVATGEVDAGIALPHLAMACATLADGVAGRVGPRELAAAHYEIDTLLPVPRAPAARAAAPDVPASALTRGPRPRT
jgi:hypothetical protein